VIALNTGMEELQKITIMSAPNLVVGRRPCWDSYITVRIGVCICKQFSYCQL